ncbi:50S ribosomal protein L23 [bacterium]|nr:50S ribosomal protein L23 [bacterium]|tara:strand:- start:17 stop:391 length:375 start_codon:yes stop_codon:yes gene_type:complete
MALFSRKKTDESEAPEVAAKTAPVATAQPTDRNLASVIVKPRITEKGVGASERNVYTFVVRKDASKHDIADAVKALYNVTPVKVNTVNKAPRSFMSRSKGRVVREKGLKKAYVYLRPGDTITLV